METIRRLKKVGEISGLMVHREYRHRGIATRLFDYAREFLQDKGVEYFTVYTASTNEGALRFYERNGMSPLHVRMVGQANAFFQNPEGS